ncbi:MAG: hypothetical protein ACK4MT_08510, partial [Thermaurantiacus tibetensis]
MRRRSPPLFLAIFGLVLLTLLVSQLVAAGLLVLVRPGGPAAMSTAAVAAEIRGGSGQLRARTRALPPPRPGEAVPFGTAEEGPPWPEGAIGLLAPRSGDWG